MEYIIINQKVFLIASIIFNIGLIYYLPGEKIIQQNCNVQK